MVHDGRWGTAAPMLSTGPRQEPLRPVACSLAGMLSMLSCSRVARILTGLTVEMTHNEELAEAVREGLLKPNREVVLAALRRGVDTGEVRPDANLDVVAAFPTYPRVATRKNMLATKTPDGDNA